MDVNPLSIPDICEPIDLLKSYERSKASFFDANNFKRAIDLLNDYLSDNPDTPHLEYIQNQKIAYIRQMLGRLSTMKKSDAGASLAHINLVLLTLKDGAEDIMELNPDIGENFAALMSVWSDELAEAWAESIAHVLLDREINH